MDVASIAKVAGTIAEGGGANEAVLPNVDFYSGIIYEGMVFPVDMFPVLFAILRSAAWLAQRQEMRQERDQRIARPRQVCSGSDERDYVPINAR